MEELFQIITYKKNQHCTWCWG